jgi:DNA primase
LVAIAGHEVGITHPDKPYFSRQTKLTKLAIVRYYVFMVAAIRREKLYLLKLRAMQSRQA